ncbi:GH19085 [Drosophila grimshawi]|uniref:GH19085 n=1 Tax=Drosophila grimshawi TaxID=7222 RepID=B4JIE8_DROGR|nr:GH19085 [Drosophila grimshawi]
MSEKFLTKQQYPQQQQQQSQQGSIGILNNKMNVIPNYTLSGMSNFDAESLPDYSEFDSESVTLDYYKERYLANDEHDNNNKS